ncbi:MULTISPECIES: BON domain-containing protein [unclassified Niveibacterium]|uniref:BON domain-containing protein n=1 Tax=unclassified Niveibacterium TaxID=2648924 RepID=UPI001552DC11|nr:BON domain-containing protein [Niveibacterium sp. COAC-50]
MSLRSIALVLAVATSLPACVPMVVTGAAVGVTATMDRRSYGVQVEDSTIEAKASSAISNKLGPTARVSVTSFNRIVLLSGEVADEAAKAEAERQLRALPHLIRTVHNELTIGPRSSFSQQSGDALTTSKVKARLVETKEISSTQVKVVTESGVAYLMGMVSPREQEVATFVASTTTGVRKVVRLFEVMTPEQIRQLDVVQESLNSSMPAPTKPAQ